MNERQRAIVFTPLSNLRYAALCDRGRGLIPPQGEFENETTGPRKYPYVGLIVWFMLMGLAFGYGSGWRF
jgi:hypothetical protein